MSFPPFGRRRSAAPRRRRTAAAGGALLLAVLASLTGPTGQALAAPVPVPVASAAPVAARTATAPAAASAPQAPQAPRAPQPAVRALAAASPGDCPLVEPQAYGTDPDVTSTARCRTLRVPVTGRYAFVPVAAGTAPLGALFKADGTPAQAYCAQGCDLAAGDYTWTVDSGAPVAAAFGIAFHSAKETRGCTATHDNGLVAGAATGTFGGPGQQLCLSLPTASGQGIYLLNRPSATGTKAAVEVFDAAGAHQCTLYDARPICELRGTAPFRAVLSGAASKAYQLVVHRTGDAAGCAAWPRTGFDAGAGAEVTLSPTARQTCVSLPAGQHSTAEAVSTGAPAGHPGGSLYLVDPAGNVACWGIALGSCRLTAGVPYTAMLVDEAGEGTYRLARRDISATASCATPGSTAVGGPSAPLELTSAVDARCFRIGAAATDKFWFSARVPGSRSVGGEFDPSAQLVVTDANGTHLCGQGSGTLSCQVSGSTSYVVIVAASRYDGHAIRAQLDTWKAATAAGWAPECAANRISADGMPARSGDLTELSTGYCAVVDMKPSQRFGVNGIHTNATIDYEVPALSLLASSGWGRSDTGYRCSQEPLHFSADCSASADAQAGQALLLLSAAKSATPVEYSVQGHCITLCAAAPFPWLGSISPASGPAGTHTQAVVRGTGLTLTSELRLVSSGNPWDPGTSMTPLSVSPDGTTLHVLVDTTSVQPGAYELTVNGARNRYTYTVTPAAGTAKSRYVPLSPSRFLDTRDGTGANRQRVGPGGVVTLQVAGVKGVPASGVTAVVMNVTAVEPTTPGHVTVYPNGRPLPGVSNINFAAGQIVPNLVTVPVVNGKVDLRNNDGSVDLVADVTGYYTDVPANGSAFTPITPSRFLDTRDGTGANRQRVGPGGVVTLQVAGVKGVPASGVTAVVMNVTAVEPTTPGHVTVYPNGQSVPGVSNLNFTAGQIVPNAVVVPVVNGKVDLRNNDGSVDLVADVTGYYSATGSTFSSGTPVRLLDTRDGTGARSGAVGPGGSVSLRVTDVEGVPESGVTAVVLNVTVTEPTSASHLIVHPHGAARPNVSNLNVAAGQTVSNLVVVPVVDGRVTLFNNAGSAHVIADLNGYFSG
ncbi:hypothetical protein SAVIM338S_03976 [Streptomyces avidinii]